MTAPDLATMPAVARLLSLYNTAVRVPAQILPDTSELPRLPSDRQAALGAVYALDTMRTWCAQLQIDAHRVSDHPRDAQLLTPRAILTERLRFASDLAHAQQLGFYG